MKIYFFIFLFLIFINFSLSTYVCNQNNCINGYCNYDGQICYCNDGWTTKKNDTVNCNTTTTLDVNSYNPTEAGGGYIWFYGYFSDNHDGLTITIGGYDCIATMPNKFSIQCLLEQALDQYSTYDVLIIQNGIQWFEKDYYSPNGLYCINGENYNNICYCFPGWQNKGCDVPVPIQLNYLTPVSIEGGVVNGFGWFGAKDTFGNLIFIIDSNTTNTISINFINSTYFTGTVESVNKSQYRNISIFENKDSLIYTGIDLLYYNSNLCFNNCSDTINGYCLNGNCYDSSTNASSSTSSSSSSSSLNYDNQTITCKNLHKGLSIQSFEIINCTGYGSTFCTYSDGSTCSTKQDISNIVCTTGHKNNSISCISKKIDCISNEIKCSVDSNGRMFINNILTYSSTVTFVNGKEIHSNSSSSSSNSSGSNSNSDSNNNSDETSLSSFLNINLYIIFISIFIPIFN